MEKSISASAGVRVGYYAGFMERDSADDSGRD